MRLSGLSLAVILVSSSLTFAQHHPGGGGSSGGSSGAGSSGGASSAGNSSGSSSSGGSSHTYSGGSTSSGGSSGGSHNSGSSASSGGEHSNGGSHSVSGSHGSSAGNASGGNHVGGAGRGPVRSSVSSESPSRGASLRATEITKPGRPAHGTIIDTARPRHELKPGAPERTNIPEKRTFFSFLRHPFHRAPRPQPLSYLPRPICPKGHCFPGCPVGQVRSGSACTTPVIPACIPGQIWHGIACGSDTRSQCSPGEIWTGGTCLYTTRFLDNCVGLRTALERQARRVQAVESNRQNACANGAAQGCSEATARWQSEENLRQNLLARYRQCQTQSMSNYSTGYGASTSDSTLSLDSLSFNPE
jgi:hypothetical protein